MAFSCEHLGEEVLASVNPPFSDLQDLISALMRALVHRFAVSSGALQLYDCGTLLAVRARREIVLEWRNGQCDPPSPPTVTLPICYGGAPLGELHLDLPAAAAGLEQQGELSDFARHCAHLIKRYDVRRWTEQRFGRPMLLVGMSPALLELETFVEISAHGRLPVLVRGEFGTEKFQLAVAIHCCGPAADGPFVQVDCANPVGTPDAWLESARGGTLYLSDVDELSPNLQRHVARHLPSRLHQWTARPGGAPVRMLASTTADLYARSREGLFFRPLLAELDFLGVTIPPLRDRPEDVEALIAQALEKHGYRADDKRTDALVSLCKTHSWPENLFELERIIARLAVMTEARPIYLTDICRHAPALAGPDRRASLHHVYDGLGPAFAHDPGERRSPCVEPDDAVDRWVRCAVDGSAAQLLNRHLALRRALVHLGENYAEPISLAQLAHHAGVSPSHLSFLFRTAVGVPFKTLLAQIRIRKAREFLVADSSRNITQVALGVGFSDLSHFERSFRRIVGQSPREFRRNAGLH